jgi:hypothetical protein
MRFSKWIVAAVVFLNTVFAIAVFYVFLRVGCEPTSFVVAWFAFTTGELWALAMILRKSIRDSGGGGGSEDTMGGNTK